MSRPAGIPNKHKPAKAALERLLGYGGTNPKLLDDVWYAMAIKASKGDVAAASLIIERMDGKVPQTIGQSDEHGPIRVVVTGVKTWQDIEAESELMKTVEPLKLVSNE